jgi:succinate dehydrogenase / fumarate reductase cytochrome b subunit
MARATNRPLSPHLQIWRWGPGMVSSILHRVSGVAATVGLLILVWWLGALVAGGESYAKFTNLFWGPMNDWSGNPGASLLHLITRIVLIGVSWGLFAHACSGVRHFVLDTGAGYELDTNKFCANVSTSGGVVLTVLFWAAILLR